MSNKVNLTKLGASFVILSLMPAYSMAQTVTPTVAPTVIPTGTNDNSAAATAHVNPITIALNTKFNDAVGLYNSGNFNDALKIWKDIYVTADKTTEQQKIAKEAARRLGFYHLENQDPKSAEAYFAAETAIARRLFLTGSLSAVSYSKSVADWASGAGAMGRSSESAALIYFSSEIKARAKAANSQAVLNREANFSADDIEGIKVNNDGLCVINNIDFLSKQVSCSEEAGARQEALTYHARQIKANAPPPEKKEKKKGEE